MFVIINIQVLPPKPKCLIMGISFSRVRMAVQSEIQPTDTDIRNAIITGVHDGLGQEAIAQQFGHHKNWLTHYLKKLKLNWKELKAQKIQEKSTEEVQNTKNTKGKKSSKKSSKKSKPKSKSPSNSDFTGDEDPLDPDQGDETPKKEIEISPQFKEIIGYVEYAADRVERVTTGDILKFYEKTKMLENEEKDFEEDNLLLSKFEALVRQYDGLYNMVPEPLTTVETTDPQPEEGM